MGLIRREDWPERLAQFIVGRYHAKFYYGGHDCCLATCDCVLAMTDTDIAEGIRGYRGHRAAEEVLSKWGGVRGVVEKQAAHYNISRVTAVKSQRGDVALVDDEVFGETLGFVETSGTKILVPSRIGWTFLPRSVGIMFWRI